MKRKFNYQKVRIPKAAASRQKQRDFFERHEKQLTTEWEALSQRVGLKKDEVERRRKVDDRLMHVRCFLARLTREESQA